MKAEPSSATPRGGSTSLVAPVFAALALVSSLITWGALEYSLQSLESVWQDRVEALADLHETSAPLYRVLPELSELGHPVAMDSAAAALRVARGASAKAWKSYLATTLTEREVALVNGTTGAVANLHRGTDQLIALLDSGDHDRFVQHMDQQFVPQLSAVAQRTEALVALQRTVTRQWVTEARRRQSLARVFLVVSGALAVSVVVVSALSRRKLRGLV